MTQDELRKEFEAWAVSVNMCMNTREILVGPSLKALTKKVQYVDPVTHGAELGFQAVALKRDAEIAELKAELEAVKSALVESKAKEIYDSWSQLLGWVPWVEGGNSNMQNKARDAAMQSGE